MKNKNVLSLIAIVVLVLMLMVVSMFTKPRPHTVENPATPINSVTFFGPTSSVDATFGDSSVTFSEDDLGTMTLPQVISASGARYANADESIVLWNKGNDVVIYQKGKAIFHGSTNTDQPEETPKPKLPAGSTPPGNPSLIKGNTFVWQKTVLNASATGSGSSEVVPNKPGVFTLQFLADGRLVGKTDCNNIAGPYQIGSDGVMTFGPLSSTLMYCEGSQEEVYDNMISNVRRYTVDTSGNLTLVLDANGGVMIFKKK